MTIEQARKHVRNAWIGAVLFAVGLLVYSILAMLRLTETGSNAGRGVLVAFVAVAGIAGLAYGVFRFSRICALAVLLLFSLPNIVQWASGRFDGIILAPVFIYCFAQGLRGTIAYHRLRRTNG